MSKHEDFYDALFEGDVAALEKLSNLEPDLPWASDETGRDFLSIAVGWANEASVKWVLSRKPEVNFVVDCGFSILKMVLQVEVDKSGLSVIR